MARMNNFALVSTTHREREVERERGERRRVSDVLKIQRCTKWVITPSFLKECHVPWNQKRERLSLAGIMEFTISGFYASLVCEV